jgi:hypothetical protein
MGWRPDEEYRFNKEQPFKCPYCGVTCKLEWEEKDHNAYRTKRLLVYSAACLACSRWIVVLTDEDIEKSVTVWPRVGMRTLPQEVPTPVHGEFSEAAAVLGDSPKASAALSRRILQHLLVECAKVKKGDLSSQIDEVLALGTLPSHLTNAIDGVRVIGNFAAHPIKSKHSGEIVPVEPGEAEWLLDTIEGLADFYFVQPAKLQQKRDALNAKLASAGKPPLK